MVLLVEVMPIIFAGAQPTAMDKISMMIPPPPVAGAQDEDDGDNEDSDDDWS